MPDAIPSLPGLLGPQDVRATAAAIARAQEPSGAIPWFPGGHVDPWDHVECAMALLVGGEVDAAERAYGWLFAGQRPDGTWPIRTVAGVVEDAGADTNMCATSRSGSGTTGWCAGTRRSHAAPGRSCARPWTW
jgi:hypothetical protein